jgi:hypothetical protein
MELIRSQPRPPESRRARAAILRDIGTANRRTEGRWTYPPDDLLHRNVDRLKLNWVTYDDLFEKLPESAVRDEVVGFWQGHGAYQGREG